MRALILRNDPAAAVASSRALIDKGFQILCVDTREVAETLVRMDTIDLLVMDEQVQGELTHTIALSGERRNPYISAILMTDRPREQADDLYDLIPSLYALAGVETAPALIGQLAVASVANTADTIARVAANAAADLAEQQDMSIPDIPDESRDIREGEDDLNHAVEVAATDHQDAVAQPLILKDRTHLPSLADEILFAPAFAELEDSEHVAKDFARKKAELPQSVKNPFLRQSPAA